MSDKVYWFHRQKSFDNPFTGAGKDNFKETLTSKFKEIERINNKLINWLQSKKDKLYAEQKSLFKYWVFTLVLFDDHDSDCSLGQFKEHWENK